MKKYSASFLLFICLLIATRSLFAQSAKIKCLASDGTNVLAGTERDGVVLLTNDGQTWQPLNRPPNSSWWEIDYLACNGSTILAGRYMRNFISTDMGTTWKSLPPMGNLTGVAFNGNDVYFSSTGKDSQHGNLYRSTDKGANWSAVNTGYDNVVISCYAFEGDVVYAGGTSWRGFKSSAVVLVSEDKGSSWKKITKGLDHDEISAMVMAGRQLVVSTKESYGSKGTVCVLDDNRTAFKEVYDSPRQGLTMNGNTLFGSVDDDVYLSEDLGKTWKSTGRIFNGSQYEEASKKKITALVTNGNTIYGAAGYDLYVANGNAATWAHYNTSSKYNLAGEEKEKAVKDSLLAIKKASYKDLEKDELLPVLKQYNKFAALVEWKSAAEKAAMSLANDGKTTEAIEAFAAILKATPANSAVINELAVLNYNKGDYTAAYEFSGKALQLAKTNPQFMVSRAMTALALNKPAEALTLVDQLLIKEPANGFAHLLRGEALKANEQPQQAIGAYTKAIQADAGITAAYRQRAILFQSISRYEDALKDFTAFIDADQSSSSTYNMRGMIHARLGNNTAALQDYGKSISLAPNNYYALSNRGMIYIGDKQASAAKADFLEAKTHNGQYAETYYGLARVYNQEKQFSKALEAIKKAIELNPKMEPYVATHSLVLISLDREQEAIAVANSLLAMNELNTDGWMYKAIAQSNIKDFAAGIATMNAAIEKVPGNYLLYSLRAFIYRQQGNTTAAAADDAKAKELGSK